MNGVGSLIDIARYFLHVFFSFFFSPISFVILEKIVLVDYASNLLSFFYFFFVTRKNYTRRLVVFVLASATIARVAFRHRETKGLKTARGGGKKACPIHVDETGANFIANRSSGSAGSLNLLLSGRITQFRGYNVPFYAFRNSINNISIQYLIFIFHRFAKFPLYFSTERERQKE